MLLIVNFDGWLTGDTAQLHSLTSQIAAYLEEALDQTAVRHVRLTTQTLPQGAAELLVRPEVVLEVATTPVLPSGVRKEPFALNIHSNSPRYPGLTSPAEFYQAGRLSLSHPTSTLNRLAEAILSQTGLWSGQHSITGLEPLWQWDDGGPVVIIPATGETAPALSLFLGHAITHYLQDAADAGPLYVMTYQDPLELQEWD